MSKPERDGAPDVRLGPVLQVSLLVRDIERSVAFYRDSLGLHHLFTAGDLAFFDVAGLRLYLHRSDDTQWRPGSILYFQVDDIAAAYDALQGRGVEASGAPHHVWTDEATGVAEWMAFFVDPDGNTLALVSRVHG